MPILSTKNCRYCHPLGLYSTINFYFLCLPSIESQNNLLFPRSITFSSLSLSLSISPHDTGNPVIKLL